MLDVSLISKSSLSLALVGESSERVSQDRVHPRPALEPGRTAYKSTSTHRVEPDVTRNRHDNINDRMQSLEWPANSIDSSVNLNLETRGLYDMRNLSGQLSPAPTTSRKVAVLSDVTSWSDMFELHTSRFVSIKMRMTIDRKERTGPLSRRTLADGSLLTPTLLKTSRGTPSVSHGSRWEPLPMHPYLRSESSWEALQAARVRLELSDGRPSIFLHQLHAATIARQTTAPVSSPPPQQLVGPQPVAFTVIMNMDIEMIDALEEGDRVDPSSMTAFVTNEPMDIDTVSSMPTVPQALIFARTLITYPETSMASPGPSTAPPFPTPASTIAYGLQPYPATPMHPLSPNASVVQPPRPILATRPAVRPPALEPVEKITIKSNRNALRKAVLVRVAEARRDVWVY